jgi:hypothetical protein
MASFFFTQDESAQIDTHEVSDATQSTVVARSERGHMRLLKPAPGPDTATGQARRTEVTPPALFSRQRPAWKATLIGFWCWLWDMDESPHEPVAVTGLAKVKTEFNGALWDMQSLQANAMRDQIEQSRSLRELWHLRAQVFKVISVHRGQIEAQLRLAGLDAHFPVKSSRRSDDGRSGRSSTW